MADGRIWFNTKIDNSQVDKDLKQLEKKIRQAEESISRNENAKLPLENNLKRINKELEEAEHKAYRAKLMLDRLKEQQEFSEGVLANATSTPETYDEKYAVDAETFLDISANKAELDRLVQEQQQAYDSASKEVESLKKSWKSVNEQISDCNTNIQKSITDIERNNEKAAELTAQQSSNGAKIQSAFKKAGTAAEKFKKKLLAVSASMLMFRVFSAVLQGISKYMTKVLKTNEEYTAQLAQLKAALATAFQPIYEFILPGLMAVMKVLTTIVMLVANVLSGLFGKTAAQSAQNAEALNKEADAIDKVGGAAKEAGKSLANFDEINTLSTGESGGGPGGGGPASQYDFSEFDTAEYKAKIDELTVYLSGALLAIGAILAFSGANIPLGIALMAAGALGMVSVVKANWGAMSTELETAIAQVLFVLGGAALAIGAILTFSGAKPALGIGLMVAGAAALWGAAKLNWSACEKLLEGPVGAIVGLISGALIAIGALLAFSGANIGLGIGLMAAGAVGLAVSVKANWNTLVNQLKGPVGLMVALIGGALLATGAILAFSGAAPALGIALMAAGAAGLVTVAKLNWNSVKTALQGPVGKVTAIVSGALLVVGAILAFSGINIPLGIALMAAGAAGLVTVAKLNWNAVRDKLKEAWEGIKSWFNTNVAPKLTLSYWQNKWENVSKGLKTAFKNGINGAITLFNKFISWINEKMNFSWGDKYLLGQKVISAGSIQLITIPQIPYLAQGAVLPPNKPFMAMVGDQKNGTNIEAPLETIKQALAEVMAMYGGNGDPIIRFEGDLAQLGRVLKPVIDRENNRVGGSLAKGVF